MGYPVTKNYSDQNGDRTVIGGTLTIEAGATVNGDGAANLTAAANGTTLGGVKAATKGAGDTVECKIDEATSKLYCAPYTLPEAAADAIGGVKLAANVAAVAAEGELADVITALNAVLTALKASGAMAADTP